MASPKSETSQASGMGQGSSWSICFEFLAQGPFIAFVPLPGPPPTASNEKKIQSHVTDILV